MKTSPSFTDAAMGRIAQGTKVIAEGGYEKIFRQTFDSFPDEQLRNSYACYLSTSAGPIMGILYLSSAKLAFCGDNPLPYKVGDRTEWSYYKVCNSFTRMHDNLFINCVRNYQANVQMHDYMDTCSINMLVHAYMKNTYPLFGA